MQIEILPFNDATAKAAEDLANKLGYRDSFAYATFDTKDDALPMLQGIPSQAQHVRQYNNGLSEHYIFSSSIGVIAIQTHRED
jgi:hypothetical protein